MINGECNWIKAPNPIHLEETEVHIWRVTFDLHGKLVQRLGESLSRDEQDKAERFYFDRDRYRYIITRGCLRDILGRYLCRESALIEFRYNENGKPSLDAKVNQRGLNFNVSHAQELALIAVVQGYKLGIDVELIRSERATQDIARRFFSPFETNAIFSLPNHLQKIAFFNCWTRKEAYIKAQGEGFYLPLNQFDVSVDPGEPAALLVSRHEAGVASQWSLVHLEPAPGYVGALAVEGGSWQSKCWQWSPLE